MTPRHESSAWRRYLHFWRANVESDVDDELRFHLEMRIEEYIARGYPPDEARQRAEERFGDALKRRTECVAIHQQAERAHSRRQTIDAFARDVRFGLRLLRRQWATALLAIACLALGIGATTTMFTVADALLIRAMPFSNGDRLVVIDGRLKNRDNVAASYPDFLDWRQRQHSFVELAALGQTSFAVVLARPVRVSAGLVTANLFRTLGTAPVRGRLFKDGEDAVGAAPVAIVSRGFAERELGGVDNAIGRTIDVRGITRTIVGVVPEEQALPSAELWLPVPRDLEVKRSRRNLTVFGWLKPNVSVEQASREMSAIAAQLANEYPTDNRGLGVTITPLREHFVGAARQTLAAMILATLLVLLVACANVAGIQLARATGRAREIAVRSGLGASRARVIGQLLTESVLLSTVGGLVGVLIAFYMSEFAARSVIGLAPSWLQPSLDLRVLAFAVSASVLTGVLFGMAPAMRLARVDATDVLRGGLGRLGRERARLQHALVVVQVALSIVLLVAAGLSIESMRRVQRIPVGFDPRGVLVFNVTLQGPPYDDAPEKRARFTQQVVGRAAVQPGVIAAGATSNSPLRCCAQWAIHIDGRADTPDERLTVAGLSVTPGYLRAMGIALVRGRDFTRADTPGSTPVMLVDETFANRYWPNGDAVGHTVLDGDDHALIVGIVRDVKQGSLLDAPEPQFYRPYAQKRTTTLSFAVRVSAGDPVALAPAMRAIVREADPSLPIYAVVTMRKRLDDALLARRTFEQLMLVFGAIALTLACAGLFAVTSFFVAQRMRELGVRVALGAEPARLVAFVLRGHAVMAAAGLLLGLGGSIAAAKWLSHVLYGIDASEWRVFLLIAPILAVTTLVAVYGPARRASAADPMIALRSD